MRQDYPRALNDFKLFIGANASGKSTILDALRFLSEAVRGREFREPLFRRGGLLNLAWKGEAARHLELSVRLRNDDREYEWTVRLVVSGHGFHAIEHVAELGPGSPPVQLLDSASGEGWWWSGQEGKVELRQAPTACALSAAAADAASQAPARRCGLYGPSF